MAPSVDMSPAHPVHADLNASVEQIVHDVIELCRTPVVCGSGADVSSGVALTGRLMERAGLSVDEHSTAGNPILVGRRAESPDLPTVLLYGHYDVQPAEPLHAWKSPPFEPEVRDGRLYGRGVSDNKGQHVAQLWALRALVDHYGRLPCNVIFLMEGEEEIGSPNLAPFVTDYREALSADFAYTADGGLHVSGRPMVLCGARGLVYLNIQLRLGERDLHSGTFGGAAPSSTRELVVALATLWHADGSVAVDGFRRDVRPVTPVDLELVAALDQAMPAASAFEQGGRHRRVLLEPNLNLAGLGAGWVGDGMKTIIPSEAVARVDVRLVADQRPAEVVAAIRAHLLAANPAIEVSVIGSTPPSRTSSDHPIVQLVAAAVADGWGSAPLISPSLAGSVPDYVFTSILRIPSVIVPYANADQANHAPNENMRVDHIVAGARTLVSTLVAFGATGRRTNPEGSQRVVTDSRGSSPPTRRH